VVLSIPVPTVYLQCERTNDASGLTPEEERALRELALGYTDEVAAARLGMSRRTLRRRVREAMDKLGARSRFQMGVLYARSIAQTEFPFWPSRPEGQQTPRAKRSERDIHPKGGER
jgi:DNA-binding CsgD family transcriptional regulator